ncbi:protein enabled isoform X2 [Malaya genurostris]|uniref:protein enabled isoform X2 n=1 Tax=Malaya genurostris TaxID=325434 RepID=UPI0026F3A0E4|nr:protein enabled isoform X2 [Malaya genurostris]
MCEQSIIGARASVMVYDDGQKKWIPSGSSSGLSKVQIFHHQQNNTFRVVGRKLQDHEVVINCSIIKGLKYNQATATFHQWRDSKFVYGLNFSSQQDAEAFARAMMHALEVLSGRVPPPSLQTNPNQNQMAYDEDMGYRTMTREDAAIMQQQQQLTGQQAPPQPPGMPGAPGILSPQTPTSQGITPGGQGVGGSGGGIIGMPSAGINQQQQQQQQQQQTHHRTSSAPPVPQPPVLPTPQQKPIYASQQSNTSTNSITYGSNSQPQYQQPIYVASNQNQLMNQMASQIPAPPMPNGAIYATATSSPNASSNVNPIYAGQQLMIMPAGQTNSYGQTNGTYGGQSQYGIPPVPQMPIQQIQQLQQQQQTPPQLQQVNAPPQAPPPPMPPAFPLSAPSNVPQPPAPPIPPANAVAPPPPPPPPGANLLGSKGSDGGINSLALQLANARLKRSQPPKSTTPAPPVSTVTENSGSSTSSGGSGRSSSGMASMMDEMAKTLARRRAQAEKKEPDSNDDPQSTSRQRAWEKSSTLPHKLSGSNQNNTNSSSLSGSESPKPSRKRFGSASEETILKQINGDSFSLPSSVELDNFKEELMREMRNEIAKAKQEIIEAIKSEFNRR